jgi:uncharacterized phage infection (PIP) family protein YhgE
MADKDEKPRTAEEAFASTLEQLKQGRKLNEEANRLAEATEAQAEGVQALTEETGRLVEEAQVTMERADDLTSPGK